MGSKKRRQRAWAATSNRKVRLCRLSAKHPGSGGNPILYAFSFRDLASLFGLQQGTVRKLALKGRFDPADLESIVAFWSSRKRHRLSDLVEIRVDATPAGVALGSFGAGTAIISDTPTGVSRYTFGVEDQ